MKELAAADVMSPEVMTVSPDMTVHELATFLTENQISGAPVRAANGRLLGMVSLTDIALGEAEEGGLTLDRSDPALTVHGWEDDATSDEMRELHVEADETLVRQIMNPTTYTVPHDTPVSSLARTMIAGRVHRLLVVRDHRVVGIVTSLDLLKLLIRPPKSRPARAARKGASASSRRPRAGAES
jgi:CBS domain-containing protein